MTRYQTLYFDLQAQQIDREVAYAYSVIDYWMRSLWGVQAPPIVSGYRDPARQAELYQRWLQGEPGISKPARQSWHLEGRAIDISKNHWLFPYFEWLWDYGKFGRNGRDFVSSDPGHFDIPGPHLPNPAF